MGDNTRPLTAFDWTMHVPMIFRRPGTVAADRKSELLVSNYDFLPSVLTALGLKDRLPTRPKLPGRDFSDDLGDQRVVFWEDTIFFEFENVRAIRNSYYKLIVRFAGAGAGGGNELYHLTADPGETKNLYDDPSMAATRDELRKRLDGFFKEYVDPQYDLWNGGRSKAPLHYLRIAK
jgi:arylsulfatase A-like enzyme